MNALWWRIDLWRKSTAFTDMTLEEQGCYRNLLDEAWLRLGALPVTDRILARASGDPARWPRLKSVVLKRFVLSGDGCYHNATLDQILRVSALRAEKQRRYRDRHGDGRVTGNGGGNTVGSKDKDVKTPYSPPTRGTSRRRRPRPDVKGGSTCPHHPRCPTTHACVARTLKERA